jgi:hypothetical protein
MSEKDNLPEADGKQEEIKANTENATVDKTEVVSDIPETEISEIEIPEIETSEVEIPEAKIPEAPKPKAAKPKVEEKVITEVTDDSAQSDIVEETTEAIEKETPDKPVETDDALNEIDASNAEDAEDADNSERHELTEKDYHAMSLEDLVDEMESLVNNRKIQVISSRLE